MRCNAMLPTATLLNKVRSTANCLANHLAGYLANPIGRHLVARNIGGAMLLLIGFMHGADTLSRVAAQTRRHSSGRALPEMPAFDRPVMFDTPEADKILAAMQVFPADNAWNLDVSKWPVHPRSQAIIATIGADKPLRYNPDMAFMLVPPKHPRRDVNLGEYTGESDPGPYPIPDDMPIEGWPAGYRREPTTHNVTLDEVQRDVRNQGGDRHAIVVDPVNGKLYEFFSTVKRADGWHAQQASIFDLQSNRLRPDGWTSADAAGLPIFPAVVRHDELQRGMVEHALRVTVRRTRRAYVAPATHYASRLTDPDLPRMGERLRLKPDFDIRGFSPPVQAILKGLKKHGMFVADNGIEWAISVAPDERIPVLHDELRRIKGSAFEVIQAP